MGLKHLRFFHLLVLLALLPAACAPVTPAPTAIQSATPAPTPTRPPTITPLPTLTASPTPSPLPTLTPTHTPSPTPLLAVGTGTPLPPEGAPITVENAPDVSALAAWESEPVVDLAWTPDGALLAAGHPTSISLYEVTQRQLARTLYPPDGLVGIAFSPNNLWLVSAHTTGTEAEGYASSLFLWVGPLWRPVGVLYGEPRGIIDLAFAPQGSTLAAAFAHPNERLNEVVMWDSATWEITRTLKTGLLQNIAFSPDASLLATSPDRYAVKVIDLAEKGLIFTGHTSFTGAINALAFSPDGALLATGHYDGVIRLWNVATAELVRSFAAEEVIESLAFSPDGQILASGGGYENTNVRLWSVANGFLLQSLEGHQSAVTDVLFSPAGRFLVSASYDGEIWLWGLRE
ncbi:MAG TPA: WD40 repeat domain-containing protein [Anaerolineales bacterium]|nr:WD40 repeat domain-containing protein [Anaerolineales bacterium]